MSAIEQEALRLLKIAVDQNLLGSADIIFANSLLDFHERKGYLSSKQAYWVTKLVDRAKSRQDAHAPMTKVSGAEVVDYSKIQMLFGAAQKADVQYPHVTYPYDDRDDQHIKMFLADNHRDIVFISAESRQRLAWIEHLTGEFRPSQAAQIGTELYKRLRAIIADPVGEAVVSGKQTGRCMFCSLPLNNEFSVTHGYGPICAENYGLPWHAGKGSKTVKMSGQDLLASVDGDDDDIKY